MSCTFVATSLLSPFPSLIQKFILENDHDTALVAVEGRFCDWIGQSSGRPAPGAPGTDRQQDWSFLQPKDKFAASKKDLGFLENGYCTGHQITGQDSVNASKPTYRNRNSSVGIGPRIGLQTCIKAFLDSTIGDVKDSNGFKLNMRGSSQHFSLSRYSVKSQGATRPFVLQGSDVMLF
ncbi:hypothetical protein BPAE_0004g00190 [Botrytis paeoniae]|uniref:Uncharacterized protein n=1 Tax=Botrytis paeoniae TaxID=278948 RepID=A0A4Z1G9A8_9HELO|nr:hypothetical protein BPAE_0004g00190 [Botrytis paeoniae]